MKPYPDKDYRAQCNRDRWHYCKKPWDGQCHDPQHRGKYGFQCGVFSTPELEKEVAKRSRWYWWQRERQGTEPEKCE